MSVNKTAEYLLTRNPNDWAHIYDVAYPTSGSDITGGDSLSVPDLQRMAKFWLMRKDIISDIEILDYDQEHQVARDLVEKIRGIGG